MASPGLPQSCPRSFTAISRLLLMLNGAKKSTVGSSIRKFSGLPSLRPSIFPSSTRTAVSGASSLSRLPFTPVMSPSAATSNTVLDLLPKISAHPSFSGIQVRCGPRNTFSPSHFVRKRRHGFLSRVKTRKGRATLLRRRLKGRSTLSH